MREPGDLVDVVEAVHFPDLHDVVVRSATTGEPAHPFRTDDDGFFSGLVAAEPGENRIEITARADDGTAVRREIAVKLDPAAPPLGDPRRAGRRRATRCSRSVCTSCAISGGAPSASRPNASAGS